MSDQTESGPPRRGLFGTLLMLPLGLIILLVVVLFFVSRGSFYFPGYFPGEFFLIFIFIFLGIFVIRTMYWSSRRKQWRERSGRNAPIRILRQRYARGEITKEQYDQMFRDLTQKP
ncbi:MAG TPA: SHOCT domain-containing protein [Candidatus Acidoferrales bacterium]|nr:SHOCT domain-containing protein [Candidatus Acidoferrales bacterium]